MKTILFILANPFNLIAIFFALNGRAIWGAGENYKLDYSLLTLFKVFGVPTLIFAAVWFLLKYWKNLAHWKLYAVSSVASLLVVFAGSEIYWSVVGR